MNLRDTHRTLGDIENWLDGMADAPDAWGLTRRQYVDFFRAVARARSYIEAGDFPNEE